MIWFKFYSAWSEGLQELSDAEAGRFIKALCACAESEEIPSLSGAEKVLYAIASKQLKQDAERNAEISRTRAEAGRIGGLSSKQTEANASKKSKCKQNEAKQANANNCSIKNKELRIKNTEEEINIAVDTAKHLTPDDHDFWKFAKENAELAETFYRTTGISPVKSQFGRWVNDLRDLAEAEITADRMKKTIDYMKTRDIPISAPGSILKTAQWLKARGSVPVQKPIQEKDTRTAAEVIQQMLVDNYNPYSFLEEQNKEHEVVDI